MSQSVEIRTPRRDERAAWEPLWKGYQDFYKVALSAEITETTWQRFHDPAEPVHLLGAYSDGRLVGIVHYILHRSTWSVGGYCYLQDLFVAQEARGRRLGRALIEAVYDRAREARASRVYWLTHETNYRGRELYDQVAENAGFIQYRKSV
jgi:GNAT superfamily N-acetyltransferase